MLIIDIYILKLNKLTINLYKNIILLYFKNLVIYNINNNKFYININMNKCVNNNSKGIGN